MYSTTKYPKLTVCRNCGAKFKPHTATTKATRVYIVRVKDSVHNSWVAKQAPTMALAVKIEAKLKVNMMEQAEFPDRATSREHQATTIQNIWLEYIEWAKTNKRSWKDDEARYRLHIAPKLSNNSMEDIKPAMIQSILTGMVLKKYKPATVMQVLILIKRLFNWSMERELYSGSNPCKVITIPKFDNRVTNPLSKDDIKALLQSAERHGNKIAELIIKFALFSGKRKGEILSLQWNAVDIDKGFITLAGTNTKSMDQQQVPLNMTCIEILKQAYEIKSTNNRTSDSYVFPSATARKFLSFDKCWQRIKSKAGLTCRFHDLRHTYASYLASSGQVNIYTLKELLGHKTIEMTFRYSHLIGNTLRDASNVADSVLPK